jgi:uncharacterized membrane protein
LAAVFIGGIALAVWLAGDTTDFVVLIPLLIVGLLVNGLVYGVFAARRTGWVRRTPEGALLRARWEAFRRYLRDFSRLEEAPPIALDLWDRYLVYAVALGVAEEVLEAARLRAPEELERASSIYWYGHHGYTGGSTENAFAGLTSALSGAFAPPSSSGGGGGFSGGGGGGGGGVAEGPGDSSGRSRRGPPGSVGRCIPSGGSEPWVMRPHRPSLPGCRPAGSSPPPGGSTGGSSA